MLLVKRLTGQLLLMDQAYVSLCSARIYYYNANAKLILMYSSRELEKTTRTSLP